MVLKVTYSQAIHEAIDYLFTHYPDFFVIGQGLWSPWYVGETMTGFDDRFDGRVIDTPVSEQATTGVGIGAALAGRPTLVTHPRVDFALLAVDQVVNQAAKWSAMFGGDVALPVTFRCIINRGGEQGAQHSQALHSWFAHIPGLRVVMPATVADARDLLVAAVLSDDPVVYIDDRWLYDQEAELPPLEERDLRTEGARVLCPGSDITLVACGHSTRLCLEATTQLEEHGIGCEVIDLRVLNPLDRQAVTDSVERTGRLCVVDGDWRTCGIGAEIIASACETVDTDRWFTRPVRLTLPDAPAPTSRPLEQDYYLTAEDITKAVIGAW